MEIALWPAATRRSAAVRTADSLMSTSATAEPSAANACAAASPMPDPAPVTSATLFSNDKFIDWFLLTVMPRQLRSFMPHRRGLVHRADAAIAPQVRSADACSREPDDCIRWLGDLWLGSVLKTDVPGSIKHGSSHGSSLL